jgi:hypothetical protein
MTKIFFVSNLRLLELGKPGSRLYFLQEQGSSVTPPGIGKVILSSIQILDRLCGLVVRVPGYRTQMYCVSCEV